MKFWEHLSRRWNVHSKEAMHTLTGAYRRTFLQGSASTEEKQMVLADLGARCGWNQITLPETAEQRIWYNEGQRAAYSRIFAHLSLSPADIAALEHAIRSEAAANQEVE